MVDGFEGFKIAFVDLDNCRAISSKFFNIDPGTKTFAFCSDEKNTNILTLTQICYDSGQLVPCLAVKGVNWWVVEN